MQIKEFNPNVFVENIINEYNENPENYYISEIYNFVMVTMDVSNIVEVSVIKNKWDNFYTVIIHYKRMYDGKIIETSYNIHPKYIYYVYYIQQKI